MFTGVSRPCLIVGAVLITTGVGFSVGGCSAPQVSQPTAVAPQEPVVRVHAWNPFLVSDHGGRIYLTYYGRQGDANHGLFFSRSLDGGTTWMPEPVRLDTPGTLEERIGFHRLDITGDGGVSVIWSIEHKPGQYWKPKEVHVRRSADFGATWSPTTLTWSFTTLGANYLTPLAGADGSVYLVWTEQTDASDAKVKLHRIAPGTSTSLGAPITIPGQVDTPAAIMARKSSRFASADWPALASDGPGRLFVAWQQDTPIGHDIYFNHSSDDGATWLAQPLRLNARPPEGYTARIPAIVLDRVGGVFIAWEDFRHDSTDIYLNRSLDGGATWLKEETWLTPDRPRGASSSAPVLTADRSGRLYLVWLDSRIVPYSVYFNRSLDRGRTWLPHPIRLDRHKADALSYAVRIGHDNEGHIYVVWWEGANEKGAIHFTRSSDAGTTWLEKDIRLDTDDPDKGQEGSRFPWLSADGTGRVYVVWSSDRTGRLNLFLNRSMDHGATWLPREIQITR